MGYVFKERNKVAKAMLPDFYLSPDKTLPQRNQTQYNPGKPAKYGMLYKSINSAAFPYTYQSHVYCRNPKCTPNEFYISGAENYIQYVVTNLPAYHDIRARNIAMDRLCSSLSVAN